MVKKGGKFQRHSKPLELIEEAIHLLRRSPPGVFAAYYLGTVPFILGFLFFWADMSRSFNASSKLIPATLGLVVAYIFMKTMQTVFALRLKNVVTGESDQRYGLRFFARTAVFHSIYQPWAFVVLPVALLFTVPFGWCFAFYQNLTVLGPVENDLSTNRKKAFQQALLWPAQNHMALAILLLFSIIVMMNLSMAALTVPQLIRILFGIETVFSRSTLHLTNTTYFMVIVSGTYLCVDPIVKAYYTLRCYYGLSLESGADLLTELRSVRYRRLSGLLAGVVIALITITGAASADQTSTSAAQPGAVYTDGHPPEEIEEAVNTVLSRLEYSWRLPRVKEEGSSEKRGFLYDLLQTIGNWLKKAGDALERFSQWLMDLLKKLFPGGKTESEETSGGIPGSLILYLLIFAGAVGAALIIQKIFHSRSQDEPGKTPSPTLATTDLEDENIMASDLPENEWMAMAKDLLDRGEVRLGIRAMYLASLAHLAEKGIISLARHKTDREYERELALRGEVLAGITSAFTDLTGIFERTWYGMHTVSNQTLEFYINRHGEVIADAS